MRVKIFALACVAALAAVTPARADVILGYRIGLPPSGNDQTNPLWIDNEFDPINGTNQPVALGTPIPGGVLTVTEGQTIFLQVTIATNATALSSPTPSFAQSAWTNTNRLITVAFGLNYPLGILNNPFQPPIPPTDPDQNNHNARIIVPFATGNPNTFTGYNLGSTAISGATTGTGIGATAGQITSGPGPERVIAVFRMVAGVAGSGQITLFDLNTSPTAGGFGLQVAANNLDEYVFHPSHGTYSLPVTVVPVPEPSSMALAGLALAGIGWRKLRRKTTKVAVAA